jgi:hypothetical protein
MEVQEARLLAGLGGAGQNPGIFLVGEVFVMSVFGLCERAIGLIRGKRLILSPAELTDLEALNYTALIAAHAQEEAVTCVRHFASVRDGLFHTYPWVFARRNANLGAGGASLRGWRYTYQLPGDCVKLHQLVLSYGTTPEYELVGNTVGCNYASVSARYSALIEDTSQWPMLFQNAFCAGLASEMFFAVTGAQGAETVFSNFQFWISEGYRVGIIDSGLRRDNNLTDVTNDTKRLAAPTPAAMTQAG